MRREIVGRVIEWDDNKDRLNRKKHGVGFDTAAMVFMDPYYIELPDEEHSDDEIRYDIIGLVDNVLFVVCTDRGESTRIISARKAIASERRLYNGHRSQMDLSGHGIDAGADCGSQGSR